MPSYRVTSASAYILDSRAFGLYQVKDGKILNLATPVWNWSRLYQSILRSIITGAFTGEGEHNADRAMNYYMGMSVDAIDILCSERLPAGVRRLADIMHDRIRSGGFAPFIGPLYDQDMTLRLEKGEALSRQDIIGMNYLVQNVVGTLPGADALTEAAQRLVRLQGFQNAAKASETAAHP